MGDRSLTNMPYHDPIKGMTWHKRYYQKNKTRLKLATYKRVLRLQYNTTIEEVHQIFENQHGLCAICGITIIEQSRSCHVDHNHLTGKIRGLLCHNCNHGLGQFKENIKILKTAIEYVVKHNG